MGFWSKLKGLFRKPKRERVVALISTDGKVLSQRPYTDEDEDKDFVRIGNADLLIEKTGKDASPRGRGRAVPTSRKLFKEYYDGLSLDSGRFSDDLFKDLTPGSFVDTPKETHDRIVKMALLQYKKNARAFSITEIVKDFVIGDEIYIDAADPAVQEIIDKYWSLNEWDEKLEERVRSLSVTGEQIYPVFIDKDGMVRLSSILPLQVIDVLRNEENAEDLDTILAAVKDTSLDYRTEQVNLTSDASPFKVLKEYDAVRVENGDLDLSGPTKYCFFFAANRLAGGTRGSPDLTPVMDWIEGMDSFLFVVLERAELAMQVVFDLKCDGLSGNALQEKADEFVSNLRAGEAYAHNEKIELNVHSPNIGSSEAQEVFNVLVRMVSAGVGLPGMFFGDSMDVNRASAAESSIPPAKRLQARQRFVKRMIKRPIDLQIALAKKDGRLNGVTDFRYNVRMPKIMLRDLSMITRAIKGLADALAVALDREQPFITAALAHKVFTSALIDLDPSEDFLQASASKNPEEKQAPDMTDLPKEIQDAYDEVKRAKRAERIMMTSAQSHQSEDDDDSFGES